MRKLITPSDSFELVTPESESSFEGTVVGNAAAIFGAGRHYLDCKRRMGVAGKKVNIPDAFLIDLRRKDPRLFVVENELSTHDLFKHIGVQLLEFSYSYNLAGRQLRTVLFEEVSKHQDILDGCTAYAATHGFRNLDNLLDYLVFETPFQAVVVIDEAVDELHSVVKQFSFPVEVIEFRTYRNAAGQVAHLFTPFLQDVVESIAEGADSAGKPTDISELDTVVVPAREDGFQETFLGEDRWYAIRMHSSMIPQIKHIAAYRVAPISAITHVAPVNSITPWQDTGKYCLEFAEKAREIASIRLEGTRRWLAPQAPRYTSLARLTQAKTLSDVF